MNAEVKAKWITALRSGEYKQGKSRLRNDENKFCCLGVLCDVQGMTDSDWSHYGIRAYPPTEYRAGLSSPEISTVVHLNDTDGSSFNEIADYIETNIPVEE